MARRSRARLVPSPARSCIPALLAILIPVPGAAQEQEPVELRRAVSSGAYVKIWGGAGRVEVVGWDRDSLTVTGTRRPGPGRFFHQVDGDAVKLGFEIAREEADAVEADLRIRVPAESTVWIKVVSAAVEVSELRGSVDVHSVSGPVEVSGSPRSVNVESMAGAIDLDLADSEVVRARGGAGDVTFRGRALDLTATSVRGSIVAVADGVRRARLESIDGDVRYRGGVRRGGTLEVETHGGDVELLFPPRITAALDLASVEGAIATEFDAASGPAAGFPGARRIFEIGSGEAEVRVRTFAGTIRVRKSEPAARSREP